MVSIIIVSYNQESWLEKCLDKINQVKIKIPFEIIVINNNPKHNLEEVAEKFIKELPNLELIVNKKNLGYAKAVNQGIKKSQGEYLLIINPDILIVPGSVEKLAEFLKINKEVGMVGPQLINPDKTIQNSCLSFPKWFTPLVRRTWLEKFSFAKKELKRYLMEGFDHQKTIEVDWLLGAALMIRKKVAETVGLMDERFFLYFEDVDWCQRIKKKGFKVIYYPEVSFFHYYQRLSARSKGISALFDKVAWIHIISAIKYFWKWRDN